MERYPSSGKLWRHHLHGNMDLLVGSEPLSPGLAAGSVGCRQPGRGVAPPARASGIDAKRRLSPVMDDRAGDEPAGGALDILRGAFDLRRSRQTDRRHRMRLSAHRPRAYKGDHLRERVVGHGAPVTPQLCRIQGVQRQDILWQLTHSGLAGTDQVRRLVVASQGHGELQAVCGFVPKKMGDEVPAA